jgi:phospholipase D1/2
MHINNARPIKILTAGRNCWIDNSPAEDCGLLIDGREYYRAFYEAARKAKHYILIAGWKFTSDVRLLRGPDAAGVDENVELLAFLKDLVAKNRDLRIYILAWDYSFIYAWEWEWNLASKFRDDEGRLQFCFDSHHPIAASHHQKYVVVDGSVAFVGGFDFNGDDWDDRDHLPEHPDREDTVVRHGPYHDVQACINGPAAMELARYFEARWQDAGNDKLELPPPVRHPDVRCGRPIRSQQIALSNSQPWGEGAPILQIRDLYLDAIVAARELIYIENQYFTADVIVEALIRRMRDPNLPTLDIVLVLPKQLHGWFEAATLEPARLRVLDSVVAAAEETGHRVGFYYPASTTADGVEVATLIHSKLLIVDDRLLSVGSANVSNRSHGLDTELNVSWETMERGDELYSSIRDIRIDLLAEHCGVLGRYDSINDLFSGRGLVERLNYRADNGGRLRRLTRETILEDRQWLEPLERLGISIDPSSPVVEELF